MSQKISVAGRDDTYVHFMSREMCDDCIVIHQIRSGAFERGDIYSDLLTGSYTSLIAIYGFIAISSKYLYAIGKSGNIAHIVAVIEIANITMHRFITAIEILLIGAVSRGHRDAREVIISMAKQRSDDFPLTYTIHACISQAIRHGFVALARRLREFDPQWTPDEKCARNAGKSGSLDAVIFVLEVTGEAVAPRIADVLLGAVEGGHLEVCQYLVALFERFAENYCAVMINERVVKCGFEETEFLWKGVLNYALWTTAMSGHRELCHYLRSCGANTYLKDPEDQRSLLGKVNMFAPHMVQVMCLWIFDDKQNIARSVIDLVREKPREYRVLAAAIHRCEILRGMEFP